MCVWETNPDCNLVANNFWGKDDAGVGPMLERMNHSKTSCDELKTFYNGTSTSLNAAGLHVTDGKG